MDSPPRSLSSVIARRLERTRKGKANLAQQRLILAACKADPVTFIDDWCWTYDPRSKHRVLPFILWPKQVEWVRYMQRTQAAQTQGICQKSRDVGLSWTNAAFFVHQWLFEDDWTGTFVADKEANLDKKGNRRTLLEKCRFLIAMLPGFMRPLGFRSKLHSKHLEIRNPVNGSIIAGETGDNAGRGGRSTLAIVDEAAHIPRADRLDAALEANCDAVLWVSSVNGNGNLFARKVFSGKFEVFTFHYRDDPRKTEAWIAARKARTDPIVWAQEREIDYGAAIANLVCPDRWVTASRTLRRRLLGEGFDGFPAERHALVRELRAAVIERYLGFAAGSVCGMDVGAGKAESTLVARCGPLVAPPVAWMNPDSINSAANAVAEAVRVRARELFFDSVAVGQGVLSAFSRTQITGLHIEGINTGKAPTKRLWPDGRTSEERFINLRAELWWLTREGLRRATELLAYLEGATEGAQAWPLSEVLLLPDDDVLARQLATLTWHANERGKIGVESKDDLSARGVASPDRADACVLSLCIPQAPIIYVGR